MLISNQFFHAFAILAIAAVGATAHADCIQINSFPYTVYESGFYCLTSDFSVNSDLYKQDTITVSASNVDIDFQGHKITNTAVSANRLAGVRISNLTALHDVNIHNGALSWFDDGILAESVQPNANNGYSNTQPSNLTVDGMTVSYTKTSGINLFGMNLRVTNNSISSVSGSTVAYGIKLWSGLPGPVDMTASNRAVVQNNYVGAVKISAKKADGTDARATAHGIYVGSFPDILIRDNSVNGVLVQKTALSGSGAIGIMVNQMDDPYRVGGLIIQNNIVQNNGIYFRASKPNAATGILIAFPGDHAIITRSSIAGMDIGIQANNLTRPDTPPVLLLDNSIGWIDFKNADGVANKDTLVPTVGGVTLP